MGSLSHPWANTTSGNGPVGLTGRQRSVVNTRPEEAGTLPRGGVSSVGSKSGTVLVATGYGGDVWVVVVEGTFVVGEGEGPVGRASRRELPPFDQVPARNSPIPPTAPSTMATTARSGASLGRRCPPFTGPSSPVPEAKGPASAGAGRAYRWGAALLEGPQAALGMAPSR